MITNEQYHADFDTISKTMLAHFHESPYEFWRYYVGKVAQPPQPKAVVIGAIAHDVLLLCKPLDEVACVYPDDCLKSNGAINPKPSREFESSLEPGQYAVKQDVHTQLEVLLNCIESHQVLKLIGQATMREEPIYWTDEATEIDCRTRPDFACELADHVVCYDLKFTTQVKPSQFWRTAKMFRYWLQDAHYSEGVEAHFGKPCKFVFWAVEDQPPHRVARYEYTQESRENARIERAKTLEQLAACYGNGDWQDVWTRQTNDLFFEHTQSNLDELDWS